MALPRLFKCTAVFLQEMLNSPRMIGAIAPSSPHLARAMASCIPARENGYVLELGPGTGVITKALLDRGLPADRLVAVEKSVNMARYLQERFPAVKIIAGDALELGPLLRQHANQIESFSHILSSLPLLNFPSEMAGQITRGIYGALHPLGTFVQFSYHLGLGRIILLAPFKYVSSRLIWFNLPPARMSIFRK